LDKVTSIPRRGCVSGNRSATAGALLLEILICTSVGQEGIDLHRHCRHVVHYDLAWNPAVLEQRTGRADRIGSKTFRERNSQADKSLVFLEVGVPFLAGTYDERMYEELRMRAQTFEILTGGDFAADHAEGQDDEQRTRSESHSTAASNGAGLACPSGSLVSARVHNHVSTLSTQRYANDISIILYGNDKLRMLLDELDPRGVVKVSDGKLSYDLPKDAQRPPVMQAS